MAISVLLFITGCGQDTTNGSENTDRDIRTTLSSLQFADQPGDLVYRRITITSPDGDQEVDETGEMTNHDFQRTARPYAYGDEDYIYEEHASSDSTSDDMRIDTYEVRRLVNDGASRSDETEPSSSDTVSEVQIDPLVSELAADKAQGTHIWLIAHLRDFPVFYEPISAIPDHVTIDASDDIAADVQNVKTDRAATADTMSQPFKNFINDNDGEVGHVIDWAGAVLFSYPVDSIDSLQNEESIKFIELADDPTTEELSTGCDAGDQDCYDDNTAMYMGRLGAKEWMGVEYYHEDGYTGSIPNSAWYSHPRMNVGVAELHYFEDRHPCYLSNDMSCSGQRIHDQFDCEVAFSCPACAPTVVCHNVNDWTDDQIEFNSNHGTAVSSAIVSDYNDSQGYLYDLTDPHYLDHNFHTPQWAEDATGVAPHAGLTFVNALVPGFGTLSYGEAFQTARAENVDVLNMSIRFGGHDECNPIRKGLMEDALAAAFDNGIFLVAAAGNRNDPAGCRQAHPPSMPRTFSVNGLRMAEGRPVYEDSGNWPACQNSYNNCEIAMESAARGGADIEVDGTNHSEAYALTDVAAPTYFTRNTTNKEDASAAGTGVVSNDDPSGGSSLAAPLVSGGALLVKEYMLDHGYDWVNLPGRLHVIMQSMADRWHESTDTQSSSGVDKYSGFGRFKLRPMKTGFDEVMRRWSMRTISITEESIERRSPFDTPTQHSANHVKCTLNIPQDHRETTDLTALDYFWVQMREPIDGSCKETPAGDLVDWAFDGSDDTKFMAAITDENAVGGNCLEYVINVNHLPDELDSQMLNVFCYAGTMDDSEPN